MMMDSRYLLYVLTCATSITEKSLMIDLQAVKGALQNFELSDVVFIRSEHTVADKLMKVTTRSTLMEALLSEYLSNQIENWIIRSNRIDVLVEKENGMKSRRTRV